MSEVLTKMLSAITSLAATIDCERRAIERKFAAEKRTLEQAAYKKLRTLAIRGSAGELTTIVDKIDEFETRLRTSHEASAEKFADAYRAELNDLRVIIDNYA